MLITRAVEEGVNAGWLQAHKYEDNPDHITIKDTITDAVISALCEITTFDDSNDSN